MRVKVFFHRVYYLTFVDTKGNGTLQERHALTGLKTRRRRPLRISSTDMQNAWINITLLCTGENGSVYYLFYTVF